MPESRYTCDKCGKTYLLGSPSRQSYAGFGQCPKCKLVLCSNCYVQGMGEVFGIMAMVNQCRECKVILKPPPGV